MNVALRAFNQTIVVFVNDWLNVKTYVIIYNQPSEIVIGFFNLKTYIITVKRL